MSSKLGRIELIERPTLESAQKAAFDEAASTHKNPIQVLLFKQGSRICASGTLSIGRAIQMMKSDPVEVKKNEKANLDQVRNAYNRPINKDHVKSVRDYLCRNVNDKYILPSLTVNAVLPHKVFTSASEGVRVGYLLVDFMSPHLTVTDGQHRLNGIRDAISLLEESDRISDAEKLRDDGISIMFSFEDNIDQVHQDFADCSKTKALPKSMIAVYDKRIPVNRLTMDMIDKCSLFNEGKIDTASTSLSAKSTSFALASNVRSLLKSLYTGQPSLADSAFDKMTNDHLAEDSVYNEFSSRAFKYLDILIESNETLKRISNLPKGPERQEIPMLRKSIYIASPAGINLCGAFIFEVMSNSSLTEAEKEEFVRRLGSDIDWSKNADIWKGSVVTHGVDKLGEVKYSINSTNNAVKRALSNIQEQLGYKKDDLLASL
ncbi:DNA sulfur modification protein DndB [Vibrio parahaemolyticus]|nr:DNA sulfur modification protein DndB [Vibrio parahaemolyticus]